MPYLGQRKKRKKKVLMMTEDGSGRFETEIIQDKTLQMPEIPLNEALKLFSSFLH